MAAKRHFGDKELPVQDEVGLLANELSNLKGNYSNLNEKHKQVEIRHHSDTLPNVKTSPEEVNLHLSIPMSLVRPKFDLVSVIPTFNGDERESVADFISKIEDVSTLSVWSDLTRVCLQNFCCKIKTKRNSFFLL